MDVVHARVIAHVKPLLKSIVLVILMTIKITNSGFYYSNLSIVIE